MCNYWLQLEEKNLVSTVSNLFGVLILLQSSLANALLGYLLILLTEAYSVIKERHKKLFWQLTLPGDLLVSVPVVTNNLPNNSIQITFNAE